MYISHTNKILSFVGGRCTNVLYFKITLLEMDSPNQIKEFQLDHNNKDQ